MTNTFSKHSLDQLATCHPDLRILCAYVLKHHDFKVQEGYRGKPEQDAAFNSGSSKTKWPNSKHNHNPSEAVDLLPFVGGKFIGWESSAQWAYFGGLVLGIAAMLHMNGEMKYPLRWGGDWNRDDNLADGWDKPHFELLTNQ